MKRLWHAVKRAMGPKLMMAAVLSLSAGLVCVCACQAGTMATYCGEYAADLERKQVLLDSIKEDAGKTCEEMEEKVEQIKAVEKPQTSSAPTGRIGLAEIIPPAQRIDIAFTYMNHTLSPGSGVTALEEGDSHRTVKR